MPLRLLRQLLPGLRAAAMVALLLGSAPSRAQPRPIDPQATPEARQLLKYLDLFLN